MPDELRDELGRKIEPGELDPSRKANRVNPMSADDTTLSESYKDYIKAREPRWKNVFGEEVDLDNIDREYALNILLMAHARRVRMDFTREDMIEDRLMQKLRDVVLEGRKPNLRDRLRGVVYNVRNRRRGYPYRAGR